MSSNGGATAQDRTWQAREQGEEARYIRCKEEAQLAALKEQASHSGSTARGGQKEEIEGGFGGQEDLEDRYATTSGEH